MKRSVLNPILMLFLFSFAVVLLGCSKNSDEKTDDGTWDIDKSGIPRFVGTNYIELDKVYRISKFRSSFGHDYSDSYEQCRSMKHYFEPRGDVDWTTVKIYTPVTGSVTRVEQEWAGTKLEIESKDYPAFRFSIFHVNTVKVFAVGDVVVAGELLGTHIGPETMSDIAVIVNDPTHQGRMVSYFEVITDPVFSEYALRGLTTREDVIISKAARDADPLTCNGDQFATSGKLESWFILN